MYAIRSYYALIPSQIRSGKTGIKQTRYIGKNFDVEDKDNVLSEVSRGKKQKQIIEYLLEKDEDVLISEINEKFGNSNSSIKSLEEKGFIRLSSRRVYRRNNFV